jgi:hypothetical protein
MSGTTKAQLQEENAKLRSQLDKGKHDAALAIKLMEQERNALRLNVSRLEGDLEKANAGVTHYRAQRDGLIGYVQGSRVDREDDVLVNSDVYSEPVRTKQTDRFLEDMGRDSDAPRRY